jgi:hypothetical protein
MALLWERRERSLGALLVAAVHDKLIVACRSGHEPAATETASAPDWSCKGRRRRKAERGSFRPGGSQWRWAASFRRRNAYQALRNSRWFAICSGERAAISLSRRRICSPTE